MGKTMVEIGRATLDFDALQGWRDVDLDDIPVCSLISLYRASGIMDVLQKYADDHPDTRFCALDNLSCNFYTLQRIRRFITENWRRFSLRLEGDHMIKWDTKRYAKGEAHHLFNLKTKVQNSINYDFASFCPAVDDDLPDNLIVMSIAVDEAEDPEPEENN